METKLPSIIVTGASGIVGRGFLEFARDQFLIYAIARRSQKEAGVAEHPNIKWIQVDVGNWLSLRWVMHNIKRSGGADYVFHLAGYYDFELTDHPEYERTNVKGTRYMLEQAKILRVKRFIFASSTAACKFPAHGETIDEKSPLDAEYAYAVSKRKGEAMIKEFSRFFPCSVVRFAAVFSDWCEYGVLYVFLTNWLKGGWNSRVLGGKGESAVPYIHTKDLSKLVATIIKKSNQLPPFDTYIAGPDGSTSHKELFQLATRSYFGKEVKPFFMPKFLALPGVILLDFLGRLIGKRPFERPWMLKYLDFKLSVDASYTRNALDWAPTPRNHILRRCLFLLERMKSEPVEWHRKNTAALKRVSVRPNLLVYEVMLKLKQEISEDIKAELRKPANNEKFPNYSAMDDKTFDWSIGIIYQLLTSSVRNNDRMLLLDYVHNLAGIRYSEGFTCREMCEALTEIAAIITARLKNEPQLKAYGQTIHDHITMTIGLTADEVEDAFEHFETQALISKEAEMREIEDRLSYQETFYQEPE